MLISCLMNCKRGDLNLGLGIKVGAIIFASLLHRPWSHEVPLLLHTPLADETRRSATAALDLQSATPLFLCGSVQNLHHNSTSEAQENLGKRESST